MGRLSKYLVISLLVLSFNVFAEEFNDIHDYKIHILYRDSLGFMAKNWFEFITSFGKGGHACEGGVKYCKKKE
jgi:hypothetical protein